MWDYFDLNNRVRRAKEAMGEQVEQELFYRSARKKTSHSIKLTPIRQILMYLGIFVGVLFGTFVDQLGSGGNANITMTMSKLSVSAIIALIFIPIEYEKLSLNPRSPFIVQFGIFVQNGVFWHVIINSLSKIL